VRWWAVICLLLVSCRIRPDTPCEEACAAEAKCADELELPGSDTVECSNRCAALEREEAAQALVEAHLRCVREATTCRELLDCP
jgi:hypothetical protein